jgi:Raf kinase inhibitor-like YbhB/YbcL family protein
MNFQVHDFGDLNKVNNDYLCLNHGGLNHSPKISWYYKNNNCKSFALILEDTKSIGGKFIHWYIPYISNNINQINKQYHDSDLIDTNDKNSEFYNKINLLIKNYQIEIFQGLNSLGNNNYFGPCAPNNTGVHPYIFTLYALNKVIIIDQNTIKANNVEDFENKIGQENIITKESISFNYKFKNI